MTEIFRHALTVVPRPRPEENDVWFKCYQCYQFVRERCVMAAVKQPGTLVVHVYDMDRNECLWKHELKVFEPPANPDNDPDYHAYAPKLEWDALSMSYDLAAVGKHVAREIF